MNRWLLHLVWSACEIVLTDLHSQNLKAVQPGGKLSPWPSRLGYYPDSVSEARLSVLTKTDFGPDQKDK
jgi:hypothetical protein